MWGMWGQQVCKPGQLENSPEAAKVLFPTPHHLRRLLYLLSSLFIVLTSLPILHLQALASFVLKALPLVYLLVVSFMHKTFASVLYYVLTILLLSIKFYIYYSRSLALTGYCPASLINTILPFLCLIDRLSWRYYLSFIILNNLSLWYLLLCLL